MTNLAFSGIFVARTGKELARVTQNQTALLLTRETANVDDDSRTTFAAANAILAQACSDEFQSQLNVAVQTISYYSEKGVPSDLSQLTPKLFNFFECDRLHGQNQIKMLLDEHRLHEQVEEVDFTKDPKGQIKTVDQLEQEQEETNKN